MQDLGDIVKKAHSQNDFIWCAEIKTQNQTVEIEEEATADCQAIVANRHNVARASRMAAASRNNTADSCELAISTANLPQSSVEKECKPDRQSSQDLIQPALIDRINRENEEKCNAQISSAKRSLITNVCLITFFMVSHVIVLLLPQTERIYFTVIVFAIAKGAMPICTTIANFGTVQYVVSQYLTNWRLM